MAANVAAGGLSCRDELLQRAMGTFRCVPLDRVSEEAFLPSVGGEHDRLYELSEDAELGEVDAFISHSWQDPPELKWQALQAWREDFKHQHGREPRVWIDKYCVDPTRVAENLEVLPVFLAGCHKLVVFAGATYHKRLWCLAELFTFISVGGQGHEVDLLPLPGAPPDWDAVDVRAAECESPKDRERILGMMEAEMGSDYSSEAIKLLLQGDYRMLSKAPADTACTPRVITEPMPGDCRDFSKSPAESPCSSRFTSKSSFIGGGDRRIFSKSTADSACSSRLTSKNSEFFPGNPRLGKVLGDTSCGHVPGISELPHVHDSQPVHLPIGFASSDGPTEQAVPKRMSL